MIVARTDAIASEGFEAALERAARYREAGADILFVEAPPSEAELAEVPKRLGAPCLANMVEGGRTPVLSKKDLEEVGYKIAIFPALGFLSMGAALDKAYTELKTNGTSKDVSVPLYDFKKFSQLMGFDWVAEFDRKYRDAG
jgi:2-methylisocitrate lyase-like PEP mutase family enzyme